MHVDLIFLFKWFFTSIHRYIQEPLEVTNPTYFHFMKIFERFKLEEPGQEEADAAKVAAEKDAVKTTDFKKKGPPSSGEDSDFDDQVFI